MILIQFRPGMEVVFTGKSLLTRAEMMRLCTMAGLDFCLRVTRTTSLLVCGEGDRRSTKRMAARDHGVQTVSDIEFFAALHQYDPEVDDFLTMRGIVHHANSGV